MNKGRPWATFIVLMPLLTHRITFLQSTTILQIMSKDNITSSDTMGIQLAKLGHGIDALLNHRLLGTHHSIDQRTDYCP